MSVMLFLSIDFDTDTMHNNLLATVGLTFAFGGEKPAPPPPPPRRLFLIPIKTVFPIIWINAPVRLPVLRLIKTVVRWIPIKTVFHDYLDKCPGTPAGVKVDKDGCPPPVVDPAQGRTGNH